MLSPLVVLVAAAACIPGCAAVLARSVTIGPRCALAGVGGAGALLLASRIPLHDDALAAPACVAFALAALLASALLVRRSADARALRPVAGGVVATVTLLLAALAWVTHLAA